MKLEVNPNDNLEHHMNDLLSGSYFPRYKHQLSYLANFSKYSNGERNVFHKWVKPDLNYNHTD